MTVVELKPDEVEFLISLRRCALCDHLGALHHEVADYSEAPLWCFLPGCQCHEYK
jgi:hypothetical protein